MTSDWRPISSVPKDETILLANYAQRCLLTGAPHVWTATYVTSWRDGNGKLLPEERAMWCECSHAAMNENGEPTHWMPLPDHPQEFR